MVILGKHRTDAILALIIKFPCWRGALEAQMRCAVWLMKQPWHGLQGAAWKPWCLEMDCRGFGGQNRASSTGIKDGFPKRLKLVMHSRRGEQERARSDEDPTGRMGSAAPGTPGQRAQTLLGVQLTRSQRGGKQHMDGCTGDQRCERAAGGRKENRPEELLLGIA